MGVCWHHVKALLAARKAGVDFGRTLTIGRLNLFIAAHELKTLLSPSPDLLARYAQFLEPHPTYAEALFKLLGASDVQSLDASDYEDASLIHDLNEPIPAPWQASFDLVDDGGTLEHVFNFPTAIRNCMEMVKVGGRLLMTTPIENHCGHGFYQFSPELFYRILSEENGFAVERMVAYEHFDGSQWYEVADPDAVKGRVELVSQGRRVMLWVLARRTRQTKIFARFPQQGDYQVAWEAGAATDTGSIFLRKPGRLRSAIKGSLGRLAPRLLRQYRRRKNALLNRPLAIEHQPRFFKPVDE